jgi:hypothetical protein
VYDSGPYGACPTNLVLRMDGEEGDV